VHSAFTFAYESLISKSIVATQLGADVPPGTLIAFIQKGLQLVSIENHLNDDGSERVGEEEFSLLTVSFLFFSSSVDDIPFESTTLLKYSCVSNSHSYVVQLDPRLSKAKLHHNRKQSSRRW
jgi:hypothetical protein